MACDLQTTVICCLIHYRHRISAPGDIDDLLNSGVKITRVLSGVPGAGTTIGGKTIDDITIAGAAIVDTRTKDALAKDVLVADRELSECIRVAYTKDISALQLDGRSQSDPAGQSAGIPKKPDISKNVGHVFEALGCSIYMLQTIKISLEHGMTPSFKKCIIRIAQEGGDADANAALAGATLGAYLGYSQLPHDWLASMPFFPWLAEIVTQFVGLVCRGNNDTLPATSLIPEPSEPPGKLVALFHRVDALMSDLHKNLVEPDAAHPGSPRNTRNGPG